MIYLTGRNVLFEGISTYFQKYSYKNTELKDFIAELSAAATKFGLDKKVNLKKWTDTWLKTPGCNEIEMKYTLDVGGTITKFELF